MSVTYACPFGIRPTKRTSQEEGQGVKWYEGYASSFCCGSKASPCSCTSIDHNLPHSCGWPSPGLPLRSVASLLNHSGVYVDPHLHGGTLLPALFPRFPALVVAGHLLAALLILGDDSLHLRLLGLDIPLSRQLRHNFPLILRRFLVLELLHLLEHGGERLAPTRGPERRG